MTNQSEEWVPHADQVFVTFFSQIICMYSSWGRHFSSGGHFIHFYYPFSFDDQGLTGGVPWQLIGFKFKIRKTKFLHRYTIVKKNIEEKYKVRNLI